VDVAVDEEFGSVLRAAQAGDEDAFAAIWRQYQPQLLRYLKVKAYPVAEDLAEDVWARVVRDLDNFDGNADRFKGWLFTTARNRVTDWYRSGQRRYESVGVGVGTLLQLPAVDDVEGDALANSSTDRAVALIARLSADQAEAVMLRVVVGLDVARVAEIMKRSPGSVRVLCHRGLKRLEALLGDATEAGVGAGTGPLLVGPTTEVEVTSA
jgi:RNA polymerase sigma-70 factor, ECF subfamily